MIAILREYRCQHCHKLLCKGMLTSKQSILEVKCRGCGSLEIFRGGDAAVLSRQSERVSQDLMPADGSDADKFLRGTQRIVVWLCMLFSAAILMNVIL